VVVVVTARQSPVFEARVTTRFLTVRDCDRDWVGNLADIPHGTYMVYMACRAARKCGLFEGRCCDSKFLLNPC